MLFYLETGSRPFYLGAVAFVACLDGRYWSAELHADGDEYRWDSAKCRSYVVVCPD